MFPSKTTVIDVQLNGYVRALVDAPTQRIEDCCQQTNVYETRAPTLDITCRY